MGSNSRFILLAISRQLRLLLISIPNLLYRIGDICACNFQGYFVLISDFLCINENIAFQGLKVLSTNL